MSHFISLANAMDLTNRFRQQKEVILADPYKNQDILPICESYDRAEFDALLSKPECAGIRIYYGMDADSKVKAIVVGYDATGTDILPSTNLSSSSSTSESTDETGTDIIDNANRCPDICPIDSPLFG
jgi:hypothetical protein